MSATLLLLHCLQNLLTKQEAKNDYKKSSSE